MKDREVRINLSRLRTELGDLEHCTIRDCPRCGHRTLQEKYKESHSTLGGTVWCVYWVDKTTCLTCGAVICSEKVLKVVEEV